MPVCFGVSFTKTMLNQAGALVHVYTDGSVGVSTGALAAADEPPAVSAGEGGWSAPTPFPRDGRPSSTTGRPKRWPGGTSTP